MTLYHRVIGIDVSSRHLDLFDSASAKTWQLANERAALDDWLSELGGAEAFVVFEATGGYDAVLRAALEASGRPFARVNPAQARAFAQACGYLAKTDRIDARMLAEMGQRLEPRPDTPGCPKRRELQALGRRRAQLVSMRAEEKTRLKQTAETDLAQNLRDHIEWLTRAIKDIERRIQTLIAETEATDQDYKLITSVPGIGPVTATTLIAMMPELGQLSRRAVAALAGIAPLNNDSGIRRGQRTIKGGRREVRRNLYMAAVAATRGASRFAQFYRNLKARGLPSKVALVATARKILVTLNAMLKTRTIFLDSH